jgi:hypothetical protein
LVASYIPISFKELNDWVVFRAIPIRTPQKKVVVHHQISLPVRFTVDLDMPDSGPDFSKNSVHYQIPGVSEIL